MIGRYIVGFVCVGLGWVLLCMVAYVVGYFAEKGRRRARQEVEGQ